MSFGVQSLVKDAITGFFILLEDTISVGDVVDLGGRSGIVESMTIRCLTWHSAALGPSRRAADARPSAAFATEPLWARDFQ